MGAGFGEVFIEAVHGEEVPEFEAAEVAAAFGDLDAEVADDEAEIGFEGKDSGFVLAVELEQLGVGAFVEAEAFLAAGEAAKGGVKFFGCGAHGGNFRFQISDGGGRWV